MERQGPTTLGTTEYEVEEPKFLDCGVPESALRFSTTSFGRLMNAPYVHPNEHKVTLKVRTSYLPLEDMEILREIVGSRLDEERQELRLSSDQFGSRIENKRHLESMLNRVVFAAQRLAKEIENEAA